nr:hypothetical protein [Tanacetum cinerariifolium]
KKTVVVTSDPLALIAEKTKVNKSKEKVGVSLNSERSGVDDFSELKKITALLEKAFNRRKFYSKPTNNNLRTSSTSQSANKKQEFVKSNDKKEINANIVFMAQIEKVLSDSEASSSSADEKISENDDLLAQTKVLEDQLHVKHVVFDTHVECQEKYAKLEAERYEYMIRYSAYFHNDKQHMKQIADQEVLYDKISVQLVELDKHVRYFKNKVIEKDFKISELEECVRNKDLEIEKYLERLNVCENKLHKIGQTNQIVHMIMPSKDILYNGRKGIGFENPRYFEKAKDLRPSLYDEKVIGLGYTLMFLTHSDEALEIEKFKRARENKTEFAYDYGSLNASYVNEKIIFLDDYFQEIINLDFENIDSPFHHSELNKDVKRYSRKDLLSCNNSHLGIRDEDTDEILASPSNEKGNSNNLTMVLGTSGCLNVDVTLLKKRRWLCGSCLPEMIARTVDLTGTIQSYGMLTLFKLEEKSVTQITSTDGHKNNHQNTFPPMRHSSARSYNIPGLGVCEVVDEILD